MTIKRLTIKFGDMLLFMWCILLLTTVGFAQSTNPIAALVPPFAQDIGGFPTTSDQIWTAAISVLTPMIVWIFGKIPQLPRPVLPVLTPFVGIVLGLLLRQLTTLNIGYAQMAAAGAVAVFIRESVNQLVTKQLKPLEASKTDSKPVDGAISIAGPTTGPNDPPVVK